MGAGYPELAILLHLVVAHLVTDFVLQPKKWVEDKQRNGWRSRYLPVHAALAGVLSYLFVMDWDAWYIAVVIGVSHFAIDALKADHDDNTRTFLLDQLAHFAVIGLVWASLALTGSDLEGLPSQVQDLWGSSDAGLVLTGLIVLIWPTGILIGKVTKDLRDRTEKKDLLEASGRYIGYAERIMIFLFILIDQFIAIGFIVATKSLFRLEDREDPAKAEYHLLGSLLSFAAAIVVGLIVRYLMLA